MNALLKIRNMKKIFLSLLITFFAGSCFAQTTPAQGKILKSNVNIVVPNFADPLTKQFYAEYTTHIKKAVLAIRNKDEATFMKLTAEGKKLEKKFQYYMSEKKSTAEDIKKKQAWNKQAMPYIQEIIQSDYNRKLEKEEE